jgi:hypothetical protein
MGTVGGSDLTGYTIELGRGESPDRWKPIGSGGYRAIDGALLGTIPGGELSAKGEWTIRVVARDGRGRTREARATLTVE